MRALFLSCCCAHLVHSQDPPLVLQKVVVANPPPPLQPPRVQDEAMHVSRDYRNSEMYLRATDAAAYNLAPLPLPLDYNNPPVGFLNSKYGPTTGEFSPLQSTGPRDPTGQLYGKGPDFTLDMGAGTGMYPLYAEDQPAKANVTFAGVQQIAPPDNSFPVAVPTRPSCNLTAAYLCSAGLSACLGGGVSPSPSPSFNDLGLRSEVDVGARGGLCGCYLANGQCWRAAGCIDLLPQTDIDYCHFYLNCPLGPCMGDGASTSTLTLSALLAATSLALLAALH